MVLFLGPFQLSAQFFVAVTLRVKRVGMDDDRSKLIYFEFHVMNIY